MLQNNAIDTGNEGVRHWGAAHMESVVDSRHSGPSNGFNWLNKIP